jgi:hypothetical protein
MAIGTLLLGIDSSGEIDSAMELIPRRNRFLLYKSRRSERAQVLDEKYISIF